MKFGTKSETLEMLSSVIKSAKVMPQISMTVKQWNERGLDIINRIRSKSWDKIPLIVRSSAVNEDSEKQSLAGHFVSIKDVLGEEKIEEAINIVIASFNDNNISNQVFIQPMLQNVVISGVAFTKDPNTGGNYIIINYDDSTGSTCSVTDGSSNDTKVYYHFKGCSIMPKNSIQKVIILAKELEEIFKNDRLDIEFAITKDNNIYLLQVRPLCIETAYSEELAADYADADEENNNFSVLEDIYRKINTLNCKHPYLYGEKTVFGVMPDWNPAEIIGIRPRNFSLSLYKEVVTDNIWAYQRDNYGYKNLRSFPLMVSFYGLPYIDVRVSFNSFLPSELEDNLCNKLVNYYIDRLVEKPSFHDKVEFEIIFSCYTLDISERIKTLLNYGFSEEETIRICDALRTLTNKIIDGKNGLWKSDIEKIKELEIRRKSIKESSLDKISRIYWLLEDCKRYGTLPFAGLARAGFIAVQMLKSLVSIGVLSEENYENFMTELDTVSSKMSKDFDNLSKSSFLEKYGHLRPGTYDILSPRYDEEPNKYFDWHKQIETSDNKLHEKFLLSLDQLNKIKDLLVKHGLVQDVLGLFDFIKIAIEGREYSKFIFTKSLSDAIMLFKELCKEHGFSEEDCSYADINIIKQLYASSDNVRKLLYNSIMEGKKRYNVTKQIVMPPLIVNSEDIWSFNMPNLEPNFITLKSIIGEVRLIDDSSSKLEGSILFIPSADPGYDWIFSHNIGGFVTIYGGINSHMAIRAGELGIPAIIGAGDLLYNKWKSAKLIQIDCANKKVNILK